MNKMTEPEIESYTLFVGEGDFSFSANYMLKLENSLEKVYATCLTAQPLTDNQLKNMNIIIENGGFVFTDVDATQLEYHHEIKNLKFSKIIFNFPHIPGKMNIRKNRQLVEQFFRSSKSILEQTGMVIVTLCQGQGGTDIEKVKRKWSDTWQIVSLAATSSFILYRIQPFNASEFDTYQCTGFRGQQKPFKIQGALTHIFKLGNLVCLEMNMSQCYLDAALYIHNIEKVFRNVYDNLAHPSHKVLGVLNSIAQTLFHSIYEESICDIITCMRKPSATFDTHSTDFDFCKDCINHLINLCLLKKNSDCINSINCAICCVRNITINNFPFCYLQAYFGANISDLLHNLSVFLRHLKQIYIKNTYNSGLLFESDFSEDYENVGLVSQDYSKKNMSIKNILNFYATYSVYHGDEFFFYTDVDFCMLKNGAGNEIKKDVFKFGSLLQITDKSNCYFCMLFDVNILCRLKYHIIDYQTLLSESSFYIIQKIESNLVDLYRPLSLYPPTFAHDISFYIDKNFNENDLFLVVRNAVGYLIKSVTLIDSYYDDVSQKHSRCYRFVYQCCDQVLPKKKVDYIHSKFMRKLLEKELNIILR